MYLFISTYIQKDHLADWYLYVIIINQSSSRKRKLSDYNTLVDFAPLRCLQSPRVTEVGRHLWRSSGGGHTIQNKVSLSRVLSSVSSWVFNVSKGITLGIIHSISGRCLPVFDHPHKKGFSYIYTEFSVFQFVPVASHPVIGHHWAEPGCLFFTSSHLGICTY